MDWLAICFKNDINFLFIQHRLEREISNSVHIDNNMVVNTIVVKTFETELEAARYVKTINEINEFIENL